MVEVQGRDKMKFIKNKIRKFQARELEKSLKESGFNKTIYCNSQGTKEDLLKSIGLIWELSFDYNELYIAPGELFGEKGYRIYMRQFKD